jgi:hypothetical protein
MSYIRISDPEIFKDAYTKKEIDINGDLYIECLKKVPNYSKIEELLRNGADPLGPCEPSGYGLLDHIFSELIFKTRENKSINLVHLTKLFIKYGMNVEKPRIPYDNDNSLSPLNMMSHAPNHQTIGVSKLLLDDGLSAEAFGEFWVKSIDEQINYYSEDPNDPSYNEWFVYTFKMIMLASSYPHILNEDKALKELICYDKNSTRLQEFRNWDEHRYIFDTSACKETPHLKNCIITVYDKFDRAIWKMKI